MFRKRPYRASFTAYATFTINDRTNFRSFGDRNAAQYGIISGNTKTSRQPCRGINRECGARTSRSERTRARKPSRPTHPVTERQRVFQYVAVLSIYTPIIVIEIGSTRRTAAHFQFSTGFSCVDDVFDKSFMVEKRRTKTNPRPVSVVTLV